MSTSKILCQDSALEQTVVDFLDVTLDLKKKEYKPFSKPGNTNLYAHTKSNHPPVITKRIPQSIQTRLSNISSNEDIFKQSKQEYNNKRVDALRGRWTMIGVAKMCKNKKADALRGGWPTIGIAKKSAKIRGFMH